jgi:beta-lactamase superfamily II metal-dependent hydrolase
MATEVHFIDCGQGNMVLIDAADEKVFLVDCNVTEVNAGRVVAYLRRVLQGRRIFAFICTHRDADHMRGINRVHRAVGIDQVWDCGLPGSSPSGPECEEYMRMRRAVPNAVLRGGRWGDYGATRLHILSAADDGLPDDCNAQSIVMKVEQIGNRRGSVILTGDSDVATWRRILERYRYLDTLVSEILMGSHHGSWTFFEVADQSRYFLGHVNAINPAMTVLSVGPNVHGHPDQKAVQVYERHSRGSRECYKVWRTDRDGTMRLDLHEVDGWTLHRYIPMPTPEPSHPYAGLSLAHLAGFGLPVPPPPPAPRTSVHLSDLVSYRSLLPPPAPGPRGGGVRGGFLASLLADYRPTSSVSGFAGPPAPPRSLSGFGRPPSAGDQARALRESRSPLQEALLRHRRYGG